MDQSADGENVRRMPNQMTSYIVIGSEPAIDAQRYIPINSRPFSIGGIQWLGRWEKEEVCQCHVGERLPAQRASLLERSRTRQHQIWRDVSELDSPVPLQMSVCAHIDVPASASPNVAAPLRVFYEDVVTQPSATDDRLVLQSSDGVSFFGHVLILTRLSSTLRLWHSGGYDQPSNGPLIGTGVFQMQDTTADTLRALFKWIYLGEPLAGLDVNQLCALIGAAHFLDIVSFDRALLETTTQLRQMRCLAKNETLQLLQTLLQYNYKEAAGQLVIE